MIISALLSWFFVKTPKEIIGLGKNFLLWGWNFFSIGYFLPRIFDPWHRDITGYGRGFDLKRLLHVFGWNLISRVIGAFLRVAVIIFGLLTEIIIFSASVVVFVFWFVMPLASLLLIIFGIVLLLT